MNRVQVAIVLGPSSVLISPGGAAAVIQSQTPGQGMVRKKSKYGRDGWIKPLLTSFPGLRCGSPQCALLALLALQVKCHPMIDVLLEDRIPPDRLSETV